MKRALVNVMLVMILGACGGEESDDVADGGPRVPQGTEEARASFESFLSSPFITETQAEETRAMVWRACAAFDEGGNWQEFEDRTIAEADAEGRTLGSLQITGMRLAAGLGISAYCPEHEEKAP